MRKKSKERRRDEGTWREGEMGRRKGRKQRDKGEEQKYVSVREEQGKKRG